MRFRAATLVVGAAILAMAWGHPAEAQSAGSRGGWRLSLGGAVYEVDELVGTPLVPSASLSRTLGRHGFVGLELNGIFNQGRYSASALAGDLDLGVRFPMDRFELTLSAGPSGILGGDSDGTPYTGGGMHAAAGATVWLADRVGITGRGRVRRWWGIADDVLLGVSFGVALRL